jgi:hypothetical protein
LLSTAQDDKALRNFSGVESGAIDKAGRAVKTRIKADREPACFVVASTSKLWTVGLAMEFQVFLLQLNSNHLRYLLAAALVTASGQDPSRRTRTCMPPLSANKAAASNRAGALTEAVAKAAAFFTDFRQESPSLNWITA